MTCLHGCSVRIASKRVAYLCERGGCRCGNAETQVGRRAEATKQAPAPIARRSPTSNATPFDVDAAGRGTSTRTKRYGANEHTHRTTAAILRVGGVGAGRFAGKSGQRDVSHVSHEPGAKHGTQISSYSNPPREQHFTNNWGGKHERRHEQRSTKLVTKHSVGKPNAGSTAMKQAPPLAWTWDLAIERLYRGPDRQAHVPPPPPRRHGQPSGRRCRPPITRRHHGHSGSFWHSRHSRRAQFTVCF